MTTYNTYSKQLISNYACIATLEPTEIVVGQSITVGALGSPFDGSFTVLDLPQYAFTGIDSDTGEWLFDQNVPRPNQILYACTGTNVVSSTVAVPMPSHVRICAALIHVQVCV